MVLAEDESNRIIHYVATSAIDC
jgi:hypothetical protein